MTESIYFAYTNKELVALIIKSHGIHDGDWVLSANLTFSAMNIGQATDGSDASPAGVVAITGIRIERVPAPLPFSINAAAINPKK